MAAVLELLTRRLSITPATLDLESGTVEVTLSTGAPVKRGGFIERLSISTDSVKPAAHVPLLDSHRQNSIGDIKGRVENIRVENGALVATLHVTDPSALAAIGRGDITGVSVGYSVSRWAESRDPKTNFRIRTAEEWRLVEASLVAIPADPAALIRKVPTMEEDEIVETEVASNLTRAEMNVQIRSYATAAGLDSAFADVLIDREATPEEARAATFEEMQRRSSVRISTPRVGVSQDDPAVMNDHLAEALACRMGGVEPSEPARRYMGMGLADVARLALTRAGVTGVNMMGREDLMTRAMHTTSDFPNLLTSAGNRVLLPAYTAAQSPLKLLARQRLAEDFRPMSLIRVGEFGKLKKVTEAGEIKSLTTGEATEGYSVETFGGIFSLSRKALINDDLGAFGQWAAMMGRAAAETEADQLVGLLTQASGLGPVMGDTKRLFHADHGNLATDGTGPGIDPLSQARLALRTQKGLDGVSPISATPKYVLAPPDLETLFEQHLATLAAAKVDDANPFSGKLTLLIEPRLPAGAWYIFADPAVLPVLEYAYLSSAQGPQLASRDGWEQLGREFRVVLDFGCGAVDWRGAYRNPGDEEI